MFIAVYSLDLRNRTALDVMQLKKQQQPLLL